LIIILIILMLTRLKGTRRSKINKRKDVQEGMLCVLPKPILCKILEYLTYENINALMGTCRYLRIVGDIYRSTKHTVRLRIERSFVKKRMEIERRERQKKRTIQNVKKWVHEFAEHIFISFNPAVDIIEGKRIIGTFPESLTLPIPKSPTLKKCLYNCGRNKSGHRINLINYLIYVRFRENRVNLGGHIATVTFNYNKENKTYTFYVWHV